MFRSLYAKLSLALLGVVTVIGVLLLVITRFSLDMYQQEIAQKLHRDLAGHFAANEPLVRNQRVDEKALVELFHRAMAVNPSIEIYLLDAQGRVRSYAAEHGKIKREQVALEPIRQFLRGDAPLPLRGDDPRSLTGRKIFSVAPVSPANPAAGYLYVILGGEEYESVVHMVRESYVPRMSLLATLAILLFALAGGLIAFALLTRRLQRLTSAVETFRHSGIAHGPATAAPRRYKDEIDRLDHAFQAMAKRLHEQMQRLQDTDRLRRELVANVSHDLRTPLAAIQGYLDTLLLRHDRLTPEEQRCCLETARRHSERLGRLVHELFELARLDSGERQLQREPFALSELVQDIAQDFRLAAERRGITLHVKTPEPPAFVVADIALMERVLENLIDNALRHTPEGGCVDVRLRPNGGEVVVEVSDTGVGIAPEHLPYIFDRFYRAASSQSEETSGAGLGLAIAKRVLDMHGSDVRVESHPPTGTTFRFALPRYTDTCATDVINS